MKTAPMDRSKPPGFRSGLLIAQISFFSHESKAKDSGKINFFCFVFFSALGSSFSRGLCWFFFLCVCFEGKRERSVYLGLWLGFGFCVRPTGFEGSFQGLSCEMRVYRSVSVVV